MDNVETLLDTLSTKTNKLLRKPVKRRGGSNKRKTIKSGQDGQQSQRNDRIRDSLVDPQET